MVRKIEEMTAVNEARMDMAMSNVDQQKIKIEDEAQKLQASELVKQFKIEMGLAPAQASAASAAEKTIAAKEPQRTP
jgi:phage shock protein A